MDVNVREITKGCMPVEIEQGDWIDLCTAKDVSIRKGEFKYIPLGIAMDIPEGYEAIIAFRSSTPKLWGLIMPGGIGIIDNSYNGDHDEWMLPVYATVSVNIPMGTRLCQFRLFSNQESLTFNKVKTLGNSDRGGIGSTGI